MERVHAGVEDEPAGDGLDRGREAVQAGIHAPIMDAAAGRGGGKPAYSP
jgi:hypothetical protein